MRPRRVRHRFARGLVALGKASGREYCGFVKRESPTTVTAHIVTTNTASEDDLGALWGFLRNYWNAAVDKLAITYKNNDFENVPFLSDSFKVVHADAEPENWSNKVLDFDDSCSEYSVVSST